MLAVLAFLVGIGIGGSGSSDDSVKAAAQAPGTVTATATATATVGGATVTTTPTKVIATRTVQVRVTYTPPPVSATSDGQYLVGREIKPGIWHTKGGDCYYARLHDLANTVDSIAGNGNITGPTTIQIYASDKAVEFSGGCTWQKIG